MKNRYLIQVQLTNGLWICLGKHTYRGKALDQYAKVLASEKVCRVLDTLRNKTL